MQLVQGEQARYDRVLRECGEHVEVHRRDEQVEGVAMKGQNLAQKLFDNLALLGVLAFQALEFAGDRGDSPHRRLRTHD